MGGRLLAYTIETERNYISNMLQISVQMLLPRREGKYRYTCTTSHKFEGSMGDFDDGSSRGAVYCTDDIEKVFF